MFPARHDKARKLALFFAIVGPLLFGVITLILGQDANWDFRNYHWYNAYAFLNDRYDFDLLPSQLPFFYNPVLDVPFYLLATHVSAPIAGFVLGTVQGLNFVLLFMLCHATLIIPQARQKVLVCAGLSFMGLLGGGTIAQIGTTFYDNITSLGLFTSALLSIHFFTRMQKGPWGSALLLAMMCGFPAGVMMGCKLPFVVFCVALCGTFLLVTGPLPRRIWMSFGFGLGVLLGLAITLGPWMVHLWENYQNPLFPYFNNIFQSPLASLSSWRDDKFVPQGFFNKLLFPFIFADASILVGEVPWRDFKVPFLYALLPFCVVVRLMFGRTKNAPDKLSTFVASRYLLWLATLSYFIWMVMFSIYRYAIPLEMMAPLLIVVSMGLLPIKAQSRGLLTVFVLFLIALTIQPGDWGRRLPWLKKTVQVEIPDLGKTDDLMILMAGFEPYSHVVPSFPPEIPFVRIQSNFASPDEDKGINNVIKKRVLSHTGRFKLLIPKYQFWHGNFALNHFGLAFSQDSCEDVIDRLYDSQLKLCDVKQTTKLVAP